MKIQSQIAFVDLPNSASTHSDTVYWLKDGFDLPINTEEEEVQHAVVALMTDEEGKSLLLTTS